MKGWAEPSAYKKNMLKIIKNFSDFVIFDESKGAAIYYVSYSNNNDKKQWFYLDKLTRGIDTRTLTMNQYKYLKGLR